MKLGLSPNELELQADVREFLRASTATHATLPASLDERIEILRRWQARCYEHGYVGRAWTEQFGIWPAVLSGPPWSMSTSAPARTMARASS